MGLGLPLYGVFLGLLLAGIFFATGQLGAIGALLLYSGTGISMVLLGALMIALRDDEDIVQRGRVIRLRLASNR